MVRGRVIAAAAGVLSGMLSLAVLGLDAVQLSFADGRAGYAATMTEVPVAGAFVVVLSVAALVLALVAVARPSVWVALAGFHAAAYVATTAVCLGLLAHAARSPFRVRRFATVDGSGTILVVVVLAAAAAGAFGLAAILDDGPAPRSRM